MSETERGYLRVRLGKKLGKFSAHIERATVRINDVNGPKGGVDVQCTIKVVLSGLPSVVVEEMAESVPLAFNRAADRCTRAVRKALDSSGTRTPKAARRTATAARTKKKATSARTSRRAPEGSLVGRRAGQGQENILLAAERPEKRSRKIPVDTAAPGVSATDRKVGKGATATRNTKLRTNRASYKLEDSAQDRPSRKPTRRTLGAKADTQLRQKAVREARSPEARAERASARSRSKGS